SEIKKSLSKLTVDDGKAKTSLLKPIKDRIKARIGLLDTVIDYKYISLVPKENSLATLITPLKYIPPLYKVVTIYNSKVLSRKLKYLISWFPNYYSPNDLTGFRNDKYKLSISTYGPL
ncbi:hypothetical protein V2W45_1242791, partial [Cenococcum geophilum]